MGEAHEKTKESSEYLKYLTQQAVALQRTMNEIYKNGSNASIMPLKVRGLGPSYIFIWVFICKTKSEGLVLSPDDSIPASVDYAFKCIVGVRFIVQCVILLGSTIFFQFTAPSMASVLEQLNIINGIIFIPLR